MHHNIAQIGCAWIAISLINSYIPLSPVNWALNTTNHLCLPINQRTVPATIILWQPQAPAMALTTQKSFTSSPPLSLQLVNHLNPDISPLSGKHLQSTSLPSNHDKVEPNLPATALAPSIAPFIAKNHVLLALAVYPLENMTLQLCNHYINMNSESTPIIIPPQQFPKV
jgi:hypothetical protein